MKEQLQLIAKKIFAIHENITKNKPKNFGRNLGMLALLVIIIAGIAQNVDNKKIYTWRDVLTTARDITFTSTRELASNYAPETGVKEGRSLVSIKGDLLDEGKPGNPVVVKAGDYRLGTITYPAGTTVRIIKHLKMKEGPDKYVILIGDTREQAVVGPEAILETGGTAGPTIEVRSIQAPREISSFKWDGPEGDVP